MTLSVPSAAPSKQQRCALVTGATSGIGKAAARELARLGFALIVTGRRAERLAELVKELTAVPVFPLTFDVRDRAAVEAAVAELPAAWRRVDVLVNNAGNAHGMGPIQAGAVADWDAMLDTNVKGLLYVTQAVLPMMGEGSHILNIGSIAGQEAYANGNVYCASKAAVQMLSKTMRLDLIGLGIKVSEINPGLVETEFSLVRFKGDEARAASVYQGFEPLRAEDIAELIGFVVTRPARVNIAEMVVLAGAQAAATTVRRS